MKKIFLLSMLVLFLCAGSVSAAVTMSAEYPDGTIGTPTIITRSDPLNFTMSVTGFDVGSSTNGTLYPISVHGIVSDAVRIFAISENQTMTHNGTYVFSFPSDQLPFDQHEMKVTFVASMAVVVNGWNDLDGDGIPYEQDDLDVFTSHYGEMGVPGWIPEDFIRDGVINYLDLSWLVYRWTTSGISNATGYFTLNGPPHAWTHEISFKDFDPWCYDMKGLRVINNGFTWSMTTNSTTSEIIYLFICDGNSRGLIAYGTRSVTYAESYDWNGTLVGFTWYDYETKRAQGNISFFKPRYPYYTYLGVKVGGTYTWSNTRITMLDSSGSGGDYREINFSIANYNKGSVMWHNSFEAPGDNNFQGYYAYFETMPGPGESIGGVGLHTSNYVMAIRVWFAGFGMGWMTYLIGFLIVIGFVGPVYSFSRKFNISMPNVVYTIFIMAGVTASWVIGFFDFWMFLFFILLAVFSLIIKYREPIEQAAKGVSTPRLRGRLSLSLFRKRPSMKDEGAKEYIEPRKQILRAGHPRKGGE